MNVVEPGSAGASLIARASAILTKPAETWDVIDAETTQIPDIYKTYVAPLAAIPAVCGAIGLLGLGGISIFGGRGGVGAVLAAVVLLVTLKTSLLQLNVNTIWQVGIVGLLLIAVLLADRLTTQRR